jgi:hypothetical protein
VIAARHGPKAFSLALAATVFAIVAHALSATGALAHARRSLGV